MELLNDWGPGIFSRLLYPHAWVRMTQRLDSGWTVGGDFVRRLGLPHGMVAFLHSAWWVRASKVWQVVLKWGSNLSAALVLLQWRFCFIFENNIPASDLAFVCGSSYVQNPDLIKVWSSVQQLIGSSLLILTVAKLSALPLMYLLMALFRKSCECRPTLGLSQSFSDLIKHLVSCIKSLS